MVVASSNRICQFSLRVMLFRFSLLVGLVGVALPGYAQFSAPENIDPASAHIRLDNTFQDDAWLVYSYDIGETGRVENAKILSSNGVPEVEQAVLAQVNAMRFTPAVRSGKPVKVPAASVLFTWILDLPREMTGAFQELYRQAWAYYAEEDYEAALEVSSQLKNYPGRNAYEEVKFQILAASLAVRRDDAAGELQHLSRVVEFQSLALNNSFSNTYVPEDQYLMILNRIQTLQLRRMMLADAGATLARIQALGAGSEIAAAAAASYRKVELVFHAEPDAMVMGELVPRFPGRPGSWEVGLSRSDFSISDVVGTIGAVFLVCSQGEKSLRYPARDPWKVPPAWSQCKIDVSGKTGTRLVLHQHARGQ